MGYEELLGKEPATQAEPVIEAPEAHVETPAEPPPQTSGPTGEQVSETPPAQSAEPVSTAAPPAANSEWLVPGKALLSERDRAKEYKARADALQRQLDEIAERQRAATEDDTPDPIIDPKAFREAMRAETARIVEDVRGEAHGLIMQEREANSRERWFGELGQAKWAQFNDWLRTQPAEFRQQAAAQRDPYGAALPFWKRATTFERLGGKDLDAWLEEEVAKRLSTQAPAQPETSAPLPPAPSASPSLSPAERPRRSAPSLADVQGSVSAATGEASGYDALFKR